MTILPNEISYLVALAGYIVLALIYVFWGHWGRQGYAFLLATLLTAAWAGVAAIDPAPLGMPHLPDLLHHVSSLAWVLFLWTLIAFSGELQNN